MEKIRIRHITKAITWRVVASATTFGLAFLIFKDDPGVSKKATLVALIEMGIKLISYYYHERFWFNFKAAETKKRHLIKSITWRAIATLITFMITIFIFSDDPMATEKASAVALAEIVLKMLIYYVHEEVWYKINWGLDTRKIKED